MVIAMDEKEFSSLVVFDSSYDKSLSDKIMSMTIEEVIDKYRAQEENRRDTENIGERVVSIDSETCPAFCEACRDNLRGNRRGLSQGVYDRTEGIKVITLLKKMDVIERIVELIRTVRNKCTENSLQGILTKLDNHGNFKIVGKVGHNTSSHRTTISTIVRDKTFIKERAKMLRMSPSDLYWVGDCFCLIRSKELEGHTAIRDSLLPVCISFLEYIQDYYFDLVYLNERADAAINSNHREILLDIQRNGGGDYEATERMNKILDSLFDVKLLEEGKQ